MDAVDRIALAALMDDGRTSWAELAGKLRLTPPAAADRVRRLEERGVITGYAALVDPVKLGLGLTAFLAVTLEHPRARTAFLKRVDEMHQVLECHHVAGDDDYLLKVRCADTAALERLIIDVFKTLPGVARTRTTVVLSTSKETVRLPFIERAQS